MVRRELAALLGNPVTAPARCEDDGRRVERVLAAGRVPAVRARLERRQRRVGEQRAVAGLERVAERRRSGRAGSRRSLA
jgi:hypothetical protein